MIIEVRGRLVAQHAGQDSPLRPIAEPSETRLAEFDPVVTYSNDWDVNEPVFGIAGDLDGDSDVDFDDLTILARYWGMTGNAADTYPLPNGDSIVDIQD